MSNKKIIFISGSREYVSTNKIDEVLNDLLYKEGKTRFKIIHGNARGVDRYAKDFCESNGIKHEPFPAEWDKYGKKAGMIRNEIMAKLCDEAYIFWDGTSKGTKNAIELCIKYGKPYEVFYEENVTPSTKVTQFDLFI